MCDKFNHDAHRDLWLWLADNITKEKHEWPGWSVFGPYPAWNFACACASSCEECPLVWGTEDSVNDGYGQIYCLLQGSPYLEWKYSKGDAQARKELALAIANLEVKPEWKDLRRMLMNSNFFNHSGHKAMWLWLASNPTKAKCNWPGWKIVEGLQNDCFACDCSENCEECPLIWGTEESSSYMYCISEGSPYLAWLNAKIPEKKAYLAICIAALPIKPEWKDRIE